VSKGERILLWILLFLAYAGIAGFLCAAAIANPDLSDTEQFVWCAIAVGWGPLVALITVFLFG
jgi:hypothetical protein